MTYSPFVYTILYLMGMAFTFGYITRRWDEDPSERRDTGWESPGPFFFSLFWLPIFIWHFGAWIPRELGWQVAHRQMAFNRKRLQARKLLALEIRKLEIEQENELRKAEREVEHLLRSHNS